LEPDELQAGVFTLVFSSMTTGYGIPDTVAIREGQPLNEPTNFHDRSK
jgi:UDP-glucose 4-epimerase